ncbi:MAG: peptidoglycan-binding protein [Chromatiaceae bacterium]
MAFVPPNLYVNWVKRSLNRLLGAELTIDGAPDARYRDAVKSFQSYEGISDDGIVGPITQSHLIRANYLVADYVNWVRGVLRATLPLPGLGSGATMSSADKAEIRRFQEYFGLTHPGGLKIDGWVGAQTEMVMIGISGTLPPGPGDIKPPPIHYIFPDAPVVGGRQPKEQAIKALTWGLIGQKPGGISWVQAIRMAGQFASAAKSGMTAAETGNPINPRMLTKALGATDAALAEIEVMQGAAYAIMDRAAQTKRASNDLKAPDLYPGKKGGNDGTDAFKRGYDQMSRRLLYLNIRSTPGFKAAFTDLARAPNKKLAIQNIYDGMVEVFWDQGDLHGTLTSKLHRWCSFEYPQIKVRCGPTRPT